MTQATTERTLYASSDRKRFFWIPSGLNLPTGSLEISTLTRNKISVEESSALDYEIPEAQAKDLARQEMRRWAGLKEQATAAADGATKKVDGSTAIEKTLAGFLGISEKELAGNPGILKERFEWLFQRLAEEAKESGGDEVLKGELDRLAGLIGTRLGVATGEVVSAVVTELPEEINALLSDPRIEKAVRAGTKGLQEWAQGRFKTGSKNN